MGDAQSQDFNEQESLDVVQMASNSTEFETQHLDDFQDTKNSQIAEEKINCQQEDVPFYKSYIDKIKASSFYQKLDKFKQGSDQENNLKEIIKQHKQRIRNA